MTLICPSGSGPPRGKAAGVAASSQSCLTQYFGRNQYLLNDVGNLLRQLRTSERGGNRIYISILTHCKGRRLLQVRAEL